MMTLNEQYLNPVCVSHPTPVEMRLVGFSCIVCFTVHVM